MKKLFVKRTVQIHAPARRVWEILTDPKWTTEWAHEFSGGGPRFHIESEWKLGSKVEWKGEDGVALVEGNVTALTPEKFLRFTVFDTRTERPKVNEEDGITYELVEKGGTTTLQITQGDFSSIPEGEKYHQMTGDIWERVLPRVKKLAEEEKV